jgi:hypothetical protein
MRRFLSPILVTLVATTVIIAVLKYSADAREVAGEAVWNLFRFFTTPFVLEFSLAIVGLLAVTSYNEWRRNKDGPEWVELEVPNPRSPNEESPAD